MPIYSYKCNGCGVAFDEPRTIADRDRLAVCKCGKLAGRDQIASMHPHTDLGYSSEQLSDALGVHPEQIADAKRRFPHHNFAPDGRMVIRSHQERKQVLKELGFHDKDSFY